MTAFEVGVALNTLTTARDILNAQLAAHASTEDPPFITAHDYDMVQDGNLDDLASHCFDAGVTWGQYHAFQFPVIVAHQDVIAASIADLQQARHMNEVVKPADFTVAVILAEAIIKAAA